MHPSKAGFVTGCQQVLALAAVLAVLAPAADTISLELTERPEHGDVRDRTTPAPAPGAGPTARDRGSAPRP
jgi:hypothetical protein